MRVVGTTTEHEALLVSRDRPFRINEILIISERERDVKAEVIKTQSLNPLLPEAGYGTGLIDETTLGTLKSLGFIPEDETIYLAKVRTIGEMDIPVSVGAAARKPDFDEIKDIMIPQDTVKTLLMGVIRGTEDMEDELPGDISNILYTVDVKGNIKKQNGIPFFFSYEKMSEYPHIGIFGGSGSGKSYALRVLIEELIAKRLPAVVFDPHYEMEFSNPRFGLPTEKAAHLPGKYELFELGETVGIKFDNITETELIVLLRSAMGDFSENMDYTARRLYKKNDSLIAYRQRIEDVLYIITHKREIEESIRGTPEPGTREAYLVSLYAQYAQAQINEYSLSAVMRRLDSLEMSGLFKGDSANLEESLKSGKTAVVRGPVRNLNIFAVYLIRHLFNKRRRYKDSVTHTGRAKEEYFPPLFIVTDEAHNLVPKATGLNDYAPARPIFREIAQEGRKYGVFLILASQRPALLDDTVNAQLNTKFILRTVRAQDIDTIERETDLDPQETERLPYLTSGNAYVSSAITGRTVPVRIRAAWTVSPHALNPFEEWDKFIKGRGEDLFDTVYELMPFNDMQLASVCERVSRKAGRDVSLDELRDVLKRWTGEGRINVRGGKMSALNTYIK